MGTESQDSEAVTQRVTERVSEAKAAYRRGWPLTPLDGKAPIRPGWQREEPPDEVTLVRWAKRGNVGLRTGVLSGIVVVDIDDPDAIGQLFPDGPPWTPTVISGRGGRHLYFEAPDPCPGNTVRINGLAVDLRGEGGQVVYPGSTHPTTGQPYRWADDLSPDDVIPAPLPAAILEAVTKQHRPRKPPPRRSTPTQSNGYGAAALRDETRGVAEAPEGTRNDTLNRAAYNLGQLVGGNVLDQGTVERELAHAADAAGLPSREAEATIRSGLISGAQEPRYVPQRRFRSADPDAPVKARQEQDETPERPDLPRVLVPGTHIAPGGEEIKVGNNLFADAVIRALPYGTIYRRSEIVGHLAGLPGHRIFRRLELPDLQCLVDEYVECVRWHSTKADPEPRQKYVPCNRGLASVVLARAATHPAVRDLRLLLSHPCFLGDDYHLAQPGWNHQHGVYYDQPPELEDLSASYEIDECFNTLNDLLIDFPWKSEADRQNFVALLLTPLVRPAYRGNTPLHMILAPLRGTGKTKLAEHVLGGVVLGRATPAMQMTGTDEERDKRILSLLMRSDTVTHLDNVGEYLDSAAIASLLTSTSYSGRVLGASRIVEFPNNLTLVASGNNVRATDEIVRRTVPIRLQPTDAEPELRDDFKHPDLPTYVTEQRPKILGCLIAMVCRWRDGQRTRGRPPKGSFEEWAAVVGGIMQENLHTKWRANEREWAGTADPRGEELRFLVSQWWDELGTAETDLNVLIRIAEDAGLFQNAFRATTERGRQTAFATVLRRNSDVPVTFESTSGETLSMVLRVHRTSGGMRYWLEQQKRG